MSGTDTEGDTASYYVEVYQSGWLAADMRLAWDCIIPSVSTGL